MRKDYCYYSIVKGYYWQTSLLNLKYIVKTVGSLLSE